MMNYHPSICHQTDDYHVHYHIILLHYDKYASDLDALRILSGKIGGQTAGQVVLRIQDLIKIDIDLNMYGIAYLQTEKIPISQVCYTNNANSPSIDWDKWLFVTPQIIPPTPLANAQIAHIIH